MIWAWGHPLLGNTLSLNFRKKLLVGEHNGKPLDLGGQPMFQSSRAPGWKMVCERTAGNAQEIASNQLGPALKNDRV